jgi:hypothetical protein
MVTKEFRKTQKETLLRDWAENKRQASLFLYQQELAKTKGIEPPKPITAEHSASVALFYLKEEIRTGDKTVEELYRLNVLKEKPARIRKTPMSKAQREQARRDRLATLQAEAEARHDARYLAHDTIQALVRTSAPPMHKPSAPSMHKRKRSLDSNESSGSHNAKRQKRAGSDDKKLVDSVEPAKDKKRNRDDDDDDEGQGKRQKREASDKNVLASTTTKEQSVSLDLDVLLPTSVLTFLEDCPREEGDQASCAWRKEGRSCLCRASWPSQEEKASKYQVLTPEEAERHGN